jgi:gliding motility-associated-like protein
MKIKITLLLLVVMAFFESATATQWYVNVNTGSDTLDGTAPVIDTAHIGPKKTINAALAIAGISDTINISDGIYRELLVINKAIVIRGNNAGIDPLSVSRNAETIITSPFVNLGTGISGNSLIEIQSCCVKLDGLKLSGDNDSLSLGGTKYGKEYEISYAIAGDGNFDKLQFSNLIISNFAISAIHLRGSTLASKSNSINNCSIKFGAQNSRAIVFVRNHYSNLTNIAIDSVGTGLVLDSMSVKNNLTANLSLLYIRAEDKGISLSNFSGSTEFLNFNLNTISSLDTSLYFEGVALINVKSIGQLYLFNHVITNADRAINIADCASNFNITISNNTISDGTYGFYLQQANTAPAVTISIKSSQFTNLKTAGFYAASMGALATLDLSDITINKSSNGILLRGRTTVLPSNTKFNQTANYYFHLDSSSNGLKPTTKIDASLCSYEGIIGNNLINRDPFKVEDKIRHYLDRNYLGWVLFKNTNLYITTKDDNTFLNPAIAIASANWNIYLDSINSNEAVALDKRINLYTHRDAAIGRITLNNVNANLLLHGKLLLNTGLVLQNGYVDVTDLDTLVVLKNNTGNVLTPGSILSFVRGTLYVRYKNLPVNYIIKDTLPIGRVNDYRPCFVSATWPAGINDFTASFKVFNTKAPFAALPASITHLSDVHYWQLINTYNKTGFTFSNFGMAYGTIVNNDLVNDPANLRVIYNNLTTSFNLGGSGTAANTGTIISNTGNAGFGNYTFGNQLGGNNLLSATVAVALINSTGKCVNDSIMFSAANSRSLPFINTYQWQIKGPSTVATPENLPVIKKVIPVIGQYTVTLIITNKSGNKDTATYVFNVLPTPGIQYSEKRPCFPVNIELTNTSTIPSGTALAQTEWLMNSSYYTSPNLSFTPANPGVNSGHLKVTLDNGCFDSILINSVSPTAPVISLKPNGTVTLCSGDSVLVKVTKSAGLVVWNDGNNYDSIKIKSNNFYKATIFASAQCFRHDSVTVKILSLPTVDAGPSLTTLPGKILELKGSSNGMVEWKPVIWLNDATITKPECRALTTTHYTLRAYNTDGCEATDTMTVFVDNDGEPAIPNLLTPNGDGHNDKWDLSRVITSKSCSVNVFTRDGLNVYTSESYNNDFDGTRSGDALPDGTYVYVIENKITGKVYTGILNLLK